MRSTSSVPLVLLLSWATSSIAAPIPIPDEACVDYASCRPSLRSPQWSISPQSKESFQLHEPHFPAHQLGTPKQTDTVEVRLLEHHTTVPQIVIHSEPPTRNPNLMAALQAARKNKAPSKTGSYEPAVTLPEEGELAVLEDYSPSAEDLAAKEHGFTAKMLKKVQLVSITNVPKCSMGDTVSNAEGKMTITYTYGYHYIRTDYTSVLVVSIVVTFFLVIIMVELLDKAVESSRALLSLNQGAIRLEDGDCERCGVCPPYSFTPKSLEAMNEPPPSYEGQRAETSQEDTVVEKVPAISLVEID